MSGLKLKRLFSGLNIQFIAYFLLFAYLPLLTFSILGYHLNKRLISQVHQDNLLVQTQKTERHIRDYFEVKKEKIRQLYQIEHLYAEPDHFPEFSTILIFDGREIIPYKTSPTGTAMPTDSLIQKANQLYYDSNSDQVFFKSSPAKGITVWVGLPAKVLRNLLRSDDPYTRFFMISDEEGSPIILKGDIPPKPLPEEWSPFSLLRDNRALECSLPVRKNWSVMATRSSQGLYGELERFLEEIFLGNFVIGILLFAIAIFLARRITKPIQQLVFEANKFSEGDLSTPVSVKGNREINILASEFEVMRQKLLESYSNLEDKIAERTEALRKAQFQISHQEKMASLGLLAAGVAHEIGNPLTGISSMAQIIKRKRKDPAIDEYTNTIMSNIERISRIVRELVDFARPANYEAALVDPNKVIQSAVSIVSYDKRAKNSSINMDLDGDLPDLFLVEDQLLQVFLNLLLNAVDACESVKGEIFIKSFLDDGKVCVTFKDNGSGIPETNLSKIFEPFFTTKKVGKGTGLGLSVSYGIIKNLGGTIKVESKINAGAVFKLEIPVPLTEQNSEI